MTDRSTGPEGLPVATPHFYSLIDGGMFAPLDLSGASAEPREDTISAEPVDYAADSTTTAVLPIGGSVEGGFTGNSDEDWIAVDVTENQLIEFTSDLPFSAGDVRLVTADGTVLAEVIGLSGSEFQSVAWLSDRTDTVYLSLRATSDGSGRDYTVSAALVPDDYGNTADTAGVVATDGTTTSGTLANAADIDWLSISLEAGETYFIALSDFFQFSADIVDANGNSQLGGIAETSFRNGEEGFLVTSPTATQVYLTLQGADPDLVEIDDLPYSVSAETVGDDYAADASTQGALPMEDTVSGRIDFEGDSDWFSLDVTQGRQVTVTVNEDIGATLQIVDADGTVLATAESVFLDNGFGLRLTYTPTQSETLYVAVSGGFEGENYTVSASELADDYAADATTGGRIAVGESISGRIETGGDEDWFRLDVAQGETVLLSVTNGFDGVKIDVVDANGQFLAGGFSGEDVAYTAFTDGPVFVSVTNEFGEAIDYVLSAEGTGNDDYAPDASTTGVLPVGGTVTGRTDFNGDVDWFRIDLDGGDQIVITSDIGSRGEQGSIDLVDADGNVVVAGTRLGISEAFYEIIIDPSLAGTYYVRVTNAETNFGQEDAGVYTLSAGARNDDFPADTSTMGLLEVGRIIEGVHEIRDDIDWIAVDMVAGDAVSFFSNWSPINFQLFDGDGNLVSPSTSDLNDQFFSEATYTTDTTGRFYLSVSSGPNEGPYSIAAARLSDEADHADRNADARQIEIGESVAGVVNGEGDVDVFRIVLTESLAVRFELFLSDMTFDVFNEDGLQVVDTFSDPNGATAELAAGTYYVRFGEFDFRDGVDPGRFALTTSVVDDDFAGNASTTGSLSLDGTVTGRRDFNNDSDWFAVELEAGVGYRFETGENNSLTLIDPLAENTYPFIPIPTESSTGVLALSVERSGTFFIQVMANSQVETYSLSLTLQEDDFAGDTTTTGRLTIGGDAQTAITQFEGDTDWFAFDATEGQMVGFASSGNFTSMQVYDADGNALGRGGNYDLTFRAIETGTYFVGVQSFGTFRPDDDFNEYTVRAFESGDDYVASSLTTGVIDLDQGFVTGRADFEFDQDWFRVEIDGPGLYAFESNFGNDARFTLYDANENELGESSGNGGVEIAQAGTYFVEFQSQRSSGNYRIDFAEVQDDFGSGPDGAGALPIGGTVAGNFAIGSDVDAFAVTLEADAQYRFEIDAAAGENDLRDTVLTLIDADGNVLARNDDGGNGNFSLIDFATETGGTVYILASTYGGDETGDYIISAERLGGTSADDILFGTNFDDVLYGFDGDDIIAGSIGRDRLFGGDGNDRLEGDVPVYMTADSAESVVFRAYQAVFDRAPDAAGYQAVLNEYIIGNLSQREILEAFIASDEFQNTYGDLSNADFVAQLYRNTLDREGDAQGLANFTNALNDGSLSRTDVVEFFANSPEFIQLSQLPSAAFSSGVIQAGATEMALFRSYQAVFDRLPDFEGFVTIVQEITGGRLTLAQTLESFTASPEFQDVYSGFDDRAFVEQLYRNVFDREGDAAGVDAFTAALEAGDLTRAQVVESFVQSFEFRQATDAAAVDFVTDWIGNAFGDVLAGGAGDDVLFGGQGQDYFVYEAGADTVLDFQIDRDQIELSALRDDFATFNAVMNAYTQVGNDAVFDFGNGNVLTLRNVDGTQLDESDFAFFSVTDNAEWVDDGAFA